MACSNPNCQCGHGEPQDEQGWQQYIAALTGEKNTMGHRHDDPEVFDDTHDILTRGETVERSSRDNDRDRGYQDTRDVINEDAHVDEEYVHAAWQANIKRTYDEFQHESLTDVRRDRRAQDYNYREMSQYDSARQNIANQALQNAVETANMVSKNNLETNNMVAKQAIRHADLSISEQWSRMETSDVYEGLTENEGIRTASLDDAALKAIGAAVADAVTRALSAKGL